MDLTRRLTAVRFVFDDVAGMARQGEYLGICRSTEEGTKLHSSQSRHLLKLVVL